MSNSGSRNSSARGSPYGSSNDLRDEEYQVNEKRRGRGKRNIAGGIDLDDAESTLRRYQNETSDYVNDLGTIRTQSQQQTRRIQDLLGQFDDARMRIDKLLSRKSSPRHTDYDSNTSSRRSSQTSRQFKTQTQIVNNQNADDLPVVKEDKVHITEVTLNPTNKPLKFAPISLSLKVDSD